MRILRILFTFIFIFVLLVVGLFVFLPDERIAKIAADQVKSQTGRDLQIGGEIRLSVYPNLGVSTGAISLSNADWSQNGPMFKAEGAKIGISTLALLGGDIRITDVVLRAPDILLEKDSQGRANWDDLINAGAQAEDSEAAGASDASAGGGFTLDRIRVSDARLRYFDATASNMEIPSLDVDFQWGSGPATIATDISLGGDMIRTSAEIGNLNDLIAGAVTQLKLSANVGTNTFEYEGLASAIPEVAGVVTADFPRPGEVFAALQQADPGLAKTEFSGEVTLTKENVFSLREGRMLLGDNSFSSEADVTLGEVPQVVASLSAGALDLKPFLSAESGDSGATGWPTDVIDASALGLIEGSITLSAASIDFGVLNFGSSRIAVEIDNSRAVAKLHQLTGYGGTVAGQFVANNRSGLSVAGDLDLSDIALQGLLSDLIDSDRFTGTANAKLDFLGAGNSVDAIMKSLRGAGNLSVGGGTITGLDLDQLFRGTPSGGTTIFDSMAASWTIDGGVLSNSDLLMDLPNVQAKGAGTVGLGEQVMDYTFTPQLKNASDTGFAFPVRITGAWSAPKIRPDLEAVAKQNFQKEIDALEDKAAEAVGEKLGVTADQLDNVGQTVEDELKKKLENEVGNALNNLLGNN